MSRPRALRSAANAALSTLMCAAVGLVVRVASAQPPSDLPEYRPRQAVAGVLRSWGSRHMATLMRRWEEGFRKYYPEVWFQDTLKGSASAMGALDESVADMALMDRPLVPYDSYGIYRRSHMVPVEIAVATGSLDVADKAFALAVFVNEENPISRLTLKELDGIFGAQRTGGWQGMEWSLEPARSAAEDIRTWGQLGLTGTWADKPIHPYGPPGLHPGGMSFFQMKVMGGADTWAEELQEFEDPAQMIDGLGKDPYGIAYTSMSYRTPRVKAVALAEQQGGPYVEPTRANVANRRYPLTRSVYICFAPDSPSGDPAHPKVDPKLEAFLRYVLSRQGQQDVAREGDYLPLTPEVVRQELRKLD